MQDIVQSANNSLEITINRTKVFLKHILPSICFIALCIVYAIYDYADTNQNIAIYCSKSKNTCIVIQDKFLFPPERRTFSLNLTGYAYLHKIGNSRKTISTYNIKIPYKYDKSKTVVKLYHGSVNKKLLVKLVNGYNEFKNNKKYKICKIIIKNQRYIGVLTISGIILLVCFLYLILHSIIEGKKGYIFNLTKFDKDTDKYYSALKDFLDIKS